MSDHDHAHHREHAVDRALVSELARALPKVELQLSSGRVGATVDHRRGGAGPRVELPTDDPAERFEFAGRRAGDSPLLHPSARMRHRRHPGRPGR